MVEGPSRGPKARGKPVPWWLWVWGIGGSAIALILLAGLLSPSQRQADYRDCMRNRHQPGWDSAIGMKREDFCQAYAGFKALERDRQDHPEQYPAE